MLPGETLTSQENDGRYFQVLRSAAGYYIGTEDPETGEPNSRETDYFGSREEAENALIDFQKTGYLAKARY